jgi:hypothetical protein
LEKQIGISKFYKTSRHASVSFVERMSHIEAASMIDAATGSNGMMPLLSAIAIASGLRVSRRCIPRIRATPGIASEAAVAADCRGSNSHSLCWSISNARPAGELSLIVGKEALYRRTG